MNNEFNNQGMNQFQSNNNFNNGYVNNQNNKNDNWKNVLIGVMAVIILGLAALTIYVVVDKKENNLGNNKENNQEENKDNNVGDKVLDEYYMTTTDVIDRHILEYQYSSFINGENKVSYSEFYKAYTVKNIIANLEPVGSVGGNNGHVNDEYDKNGVKYPDYCGDYATSCVENIAKDFGLTVDEINKMDKNVWDSNIGGQYSFEMYDAKDVKDKYLDIYNDIFDESFSIHYQVSESSGGYFYRYDKNLDKIITNSHGGAVSCFDERVIIDSKVESNLYKVRFVEGHFERDLDDPDTNGKYILVIDSNNKISNIVDREKALKDNKDKLPNYEVVFEKTNTGYKFKEINKVSNNISESDALAIGNELWEYAYSTYWGSEPAWIEHLSDLPNEYGEREIICDTTIEQVKQKYSADFEAQSCLSDGSSCIDYTVETFVPKFTCEGAGRGGLQNYKETTLIVNSIQKDKIIFTAKSEYCGSSFCQESNETVKEIKKDFIIVKKNDNWLISNFYLPN